MIFPSHIFLLAFLPAVLLGWYGFRNVRVRLAILTTASYIFYGWWDWRFTILLFGTSLIDYGCVRRIDQARRLNPAEPAGKKVGLNWLMISISCNLLVLGFFKYSGFLAHNLNSVAKLFFATEPIPVIDLVLPIGISFYTFQTMSYTIDVYRGRCRPAKNFLYFATSVSLFPHLVAGPIIRYAQLEEQFNNLPDKKFSYQETADGIWLFVIGFTKKVWIADTFAPVAATAFDGIGNVQLFTAWTGAIAYTLQLYFDFSGYSDMARGLGKILGFEFPINFNSPYKARSISEFWNRWHITLSNWLRDYLYIPLGGSRAGTVKTIRNLFIVMFLGGLWHGAAWTFILWGVYHGTLLAIHAAWRKFDDRTIPQWIAIPGTLLLVIFGWVVFRAHSVPQAIGIYASMVGLNGMEPLAYYSQTLGTYLPAIYGAFGGMHGLAFLLMAVAIVVLAPNAEALRRPRHPLFAVGLTLIVLLTITTLTTEAPFLYYQF